MPYTRRAPRTRGARRPRKTYRKRRVGNFSNRVKTVVRSMAEKHVSTILYENAECTWDGRLHSYNLIAQGDGQSDRTGRMIQPTAIAYNFGVTNSNQNDPHTWTFIWFRDNQQVGDTLPTASQLLTPEAINTVRAPLAMLNLNNRGRFTVIKRRQFTVQDKDSGYSQMSFKGYIRLPKGKAIRYNGSGTGDIERNGFYLLIISSSDPANNDSFLNGETRMYYADI